jgi:hypothetical protein
MLNCWHIALRAENPAANRYQAYDIHIDRDLFGMWGIIVSWGRISESCEWTLHASGHYIGSI